MIIKTAEGSAVANSHKMAIVLSSEGLLESLKSPYFKGNSLIAQKFINHSAKIHKIYVLGKFIDK